MIEDDVTGTTSLMLLRHGLPFRARERRFIVRHSKRLGARCVRGLHAVDDEVSLQKLRDAFTYEETNNYTNAEGSRESFSTFASRSVKQLRRIPAELSQKHLKLSVAFEHYESLDLQTRITAVTSGRQLVDALTLSQKDAAQGNEALPQHPAPLTVAVERVRFFPWQGGGLTLDGCVRKVILDTELVGNALDDSPLQIPGVSRRELSRTCFSKSAEVSNSSEETSEDEMADLEQGSDAWKEFRKTRLTASSLSNVLGMFGDPGECIRNVWLEKIGLKQPFQGNALTQWGTTREKDALLGYETITGHKVKKRGIGVMGTHAAETWIGASPDGIIRIQSQEKEIRLPPHQREILVPSSTKGLLEIKCPAGRLGQFPEDALPYEGMPGYYMPQVQCLMDVFDLEWCHLYVWTLRNGSNLFLIPRDEPYFLELYEYLATFWWKHVIPAKNCLANPNATESYLDYVPPGLSPVHLVQESRRLAAAAKRLSFDPQGRLIH